MLTTKDESASVLELCQSSSEKGPSPAAKARSLLERPYHTVGLLRSPEIPPAPIRTVCESQDLIDYRAMFARARRGDRPDWKPATHKRISSCSLERIVLSLERIVLFPTNWRSFRGAILALEMPRAGSCYEH